MYSKLLSKLRSPPHSSGAPRWALAHLRNRGPGTALLAHKERGVAVTGSDRDSHQALTFCISVLEKSSQAYCCMGETAAAVQGVRMPIEGPIPICLSVQWDNFAAIKEGFPQLQQAQVQQQPGGVSYCTGHIHGVPFTVMCHHNHVVVSDPHRVSTTYMGLSVWAQSLYEVRRLAPPPLAQAVSARLAKLQQELTSHNGAIWQQEEAGGAWVERHGPPSECAKWIKKDPLGRLAPLDKHLVRGDHRNHQEGPLASSLVSPSLLDQRMLTGQRVVNLLGSHGVKAIALALLGADVTVVDVSPANKKYAEELAQAAGVHLRYVVSDVLSLPPEELQPVNDLVLMEMGVLHYFIDLRPLMDLVARILKVGGRFLLREFHPVSTKLISHKGKRHLVTGNYFDQQLAEHTVAYSKYVKKINKTLPPPAAEGGGALRPSEQVLLRRWTLGEVVTEVAHAGLCIQVLEEEQAPSLDTLGVPKVFTLVAIKM